MWKKETSSNFFRKTKKNLMPQSRPLPPLLWSNPLHPTSPCWYVPHGPKIPIQISTSHPFPPRVVSSRMDLVLRKMPDSDATYPQISSPCSHMSNQFKSHQCHAPPEKWRRYKKSTMSITVSWLIELLVNTHSSPPPSTARNVSRSSICLQWYCNQINGSAMFFGLAPGAKGQKTGGTLVSPIAMRLSCQTAHNSPQ